MSIKMVALDLDGTTLNSKGRISEITVATLRNATDVGAQIVVSTGRAFSTLPDDIKKVGCIKYAITSNGAVINDLNTGDRIYTAFLSQAAIKRSIELVREYDLLIEAFCDGTAYIEEILYEDIIKNGCGYRNRDYVLKTRKPMHDICSFMERNSDRIENINFFFHTLEELEERRAEIETIPEAKITSSFKNNLEVGGPNTSKSTALRFLMDKFGISREELMCCGDAPNDIEMIKFAGVGVAMGNAWGDTKSYADYITSSNDEDGVAKAIDKFVLGKEE